MSMARVRTAMESGSKVIKKYLTCVEFPRKMTIAKVPVAKHFIVSAILWKFRDCQYGYQSSNFFNVQPLALGQYLSHTE